MTRFYSLISTAIIVAIGAVVFAEAQAQPNNVSTILGPDFSGIWRAEDAEPPGRSGVRRHPDYEQRGSRGVGGVRQAPVPAIADVTDPLLQPRTAEALKDVVDRRIAGEVILPARSLCWPNGVPAIVELGGQPIEFLQTENQVTIHHMEGPEMRYIYLDVSHSENITPSWYGESVGHFEGNTLVVDTIGMNDRTVVDDFQTPHSEKLHVVERYALLEDGETIEVQYSVDDPEAFTEVWTGSRILHRIMGAPMFEEFYCAESNLDILTGGEYPMPTATRLDF